MSLSLSQMASSDSGLPQELMSSEGDGGEVVSGTTTLMVTGLTSDQLAVATSTDEAVQQATIQAVLQAAGHTGERGGLYHKPTLEGSTCCPSTLKSSVSSCIFQSHCDR